MYHNVDDEAGFNTVSAKNFEEQIAFLKFEKKFNIVPIDDYVENLRLQKKQKLLTITFDDAYVSLTSKVLPVIKKYDIPISVFVPVNFVGKHNEWDTKNGYNKIDILTWNDIRHLTNERLITIGSHGLTHTSLGIADKKTLEDELLDSKQVLETELGVDIKYFSFPFGQLKDICKNPSKVLSEYGYKAALSTVWNRTNKIKNQYLLNRIEIQSTDDINSFTSKLNRKIDLKFLKQQLKTLLFRLKILK